MLFRPVAEPGPVIQARRLRTAARRVLFHILDEAEAKFPFDGLIEFEEPESHEKLQIDAGTFRADYLSESRNSADVSPRCFRSASTRAARYDAVRSG
jgi:hypothetical protein